MTVPASADDARKATEAEYGQYVATEAIDINGVRAFNEGDPVPVSHVERGVVQSYQVAKRNTKAAARATGADTEGK